MWHLVLTALVLAADPNPEPDSGIPRGTAPRILTARVQNNVLLSSQQRTTYQTQTISVNRIINGMQVTTTETRTVPVTRTHTVSWDLSKAKITDGSGANIDLTTLRKRLAKEGAVLVSADGKPIDKGYLALLGRSAIVIVLPVALAANTPPTTAPPMIPVPLPNPKK